MVGVLVPEAYVGPTIPEKSSDPTQQTIDNNNFPKTESGGFFKHFEGFFKSFKKKVKSNKPDPPKTEINLSTAVKSIIQDTTTKTTIIGARNIGKSFLINTLLESTAPSDKEYAEQRDAALFAEQVYRNTATSFSEPILTDPEPITSYKKTTAYEFGSTDHSTSSSSTDMDESYTFSTGYSFTEPETTTVDDVEFEWEIGKIEQTLVPDSNFINTIQWDKEQQSIYTLDDMHSFLMPQGVDGGLHCIEIRHGKIPELIVTFVDQVKLRQELWEVHEVEAGTRRIKNIAHKQLLETRYRTVLGLSKQQKIPLGHIKSPHDFVLSPDVLGLLGKSYRFRGLGENFNLDRIYVREKLRDVIVNYSFYVCNLLVKMPCGLLEGNKDLVEISSIEVTNPKTIQSISTANLLIVLLDKKGITSEIADTMRSTGFLEKALRSPEQHKAIFIEMSETQMSKSTISEPSIKVEFESYKHCISLQYKLLLSEQTAHWPSIEKVVMSTTVLSVRPRLFALLHAGRDSPLIDKQSHLEALSATSIPALAGCIANMSIIKCSEHLRDMNNDWMTRISLPATKANVATTAVPLDKVQELLGRKEDEKMDEVTVMLDQLTVSFHDKFDRFRTEMVDTIESLDAVLVPKAHESLEQCETSKAEGNALLAAYVSKLMSGPLAKAAPVAWSQNVAQVVPKKIQDLLNYSDAILKECVSLVEKTEDNTEKSRLKTLVHFCQGTHERAVKRLEDFKKQLHSDTMPIVKDACVDAVFTSRGNLPEISMVAAKNIKAKFSEKLKSDMQHLDMMEKDLQRALKSIMVVLKAKPNSSLKIEVQQSLRQLPLDLQFMKKNTVEEDLVMRYAQEEKYEKREPWSTITSVYTAYEEVDTSRIFTKNSWSSLDPSRNVQFQEQLAKAGLVSHNVIHDASSQYRSLAHQVYGTEDAHSVVRLLLMSEILSNPSHYERYISMKGLDIQEYVSRSAKDTEWGDHLSLCAFANFYGSDLLIYSPMFTHPLLIQTKNPQTNRVFCIAYVNVNEYKSLKEEVKREVEDVKMSSAIVKSTQTVVSSIPKHYKVSQETKLAKCFTPISLVQLCLHKISQNLDIMPSLVGLLPEELTQRLLTLLISQRKVDDSVLERLVDSSMRTLELDGCSSITDASCRHIARSCDDLRRISLSNCIRIGNESLVQFSYQCPNLEYLNLSGCSSISNSGVTEIIRKSKNLQYLNLTGCSKITDAALNEISLTCPQLHTLIVKDCSKITDQAFHFVNKNIMVLDLSGCDLITDQCIVQIAKHCSQLSSVKISSKNITDESICFLAEKCRMLSVVDMSGCEMVSDISVKSLGKNCPMLEVLNLSCCKLISNESFTDAEIRPLFPYLTSLDLSRCLNISDEAIQIIATDCDRLESIHLSSCEDITDNGIIALVSKCSKLKEVNLSKCINITDVSALELAKCSSLEKLSLYNCHKLTDQGLSQIGIGCTKLREIDISSCQNLTDVSIAAITQGCPFIESLSIEECNITENGVFSIAENCSLIQTLKLACCKGATSNSIERIGKGCPSISYLDLSYCSQVSMSSVKKCLNLWPNLKYLSLRGFQHITNESIEHANLQELNLSWCKNIVDAGVEQIAIGCPNLVNIDLAWANKITANSIHKLAQKVPTLRSLNLRGCAKVALLTLKYLSGGNVMIYT